MLSPEMYETIPDELSFLINETQAWVISEIAAGLRESEDLIPKSEWMLLRINMIREFDTNFKKELAKMSAMSLSEIDEIFEKAASYANVYDKRLFDEKGIPFVEYKNNAWLQQITQATAEQSKGTFKNLTRTVGFTTSKGEFLPPREYFTQKLSEAEFEVATGVTTYNEAIKRTVRELVDSGMKSVEYPYANPRRVETSVRANILTGVSNLSGEVAWKNIETLGLTIVETTAHHNARPDHVVWQGKRFALNGSISDIREKAQARYEEDKGVQAMRKAEERIKQ